MEDRLVTLETKSAYQEHLIQQLNEVVIVQQQQIDALQKTLKQWQDHLQHGGFETSTQEDLPPHY